MGGTQGESKETDEEAEVKTTIEEKVSELICRRPVEGLPANAAVWQARLAFYTNGHHTICVYPSHSSLLLGKHTVIRQ